MNDIPKQKKIDQAVKELRDRTGLPEDAARGVIEQLEKKRIGQESHKHQAVSKKHVGLSMIILALFSLVGLT